MPCSYLHRGTDFNRLVRTLEPSSVRRLVRVDSPRKPRNAGGPHGPGSLTCSLNLKEEEEREREREWQPSSVALAKEREREWLCGRKREGQRECGEDFPFAHIPSERKRVQSLQLPGLLTISLPMQKQLFNGPWMDSGLGLPTTSWQTLRECVSSVEASIRLQEQLMQSAPKLHAPGLSQDSP